jgi:hypothetical protein
MRRSILSFLLLAAACSMGTQPAADRPEVAVRQLSPIFFGSGYSAPVTIGVAIRNPAKEAILVRRVRLEAGPGMIEYSVRPGERLINEALAPGEAKAVQINMTAYTNIARLHSVERLALRVFLEFEREGTKRREIYMFRQVSE